MLRIERSTVQLYAPLLLPLGLELVGFIFLAVGLAPRRREDEIAPAPVATPEPVAIPEPAIAKPAKRSQAVAKLMQEAATPKPGAVGTRAYYLARLGREAPVLASRVQSGELSVYAASVAAGFRKAPKKSQWASIEAYAKEAVTP